MPSALFATCADTFSAKDCIQSTQVDRCINLEPDVPTINTLDEARIMNKVYNGQVRVENLNGTYAMIEHNKSMHIGSVGGAALEHLTSRIEDIEKRQAPACTHNACAIVTNCGQTCAFCYPVVCV